MKKIDIKMKYIFIFIILLFLAICFLISINPLSEKVDSADIRIVSDEMVLYTFTEEELKEFESIQVEKTIVSGNSKNETGIYTGIPLCELLDFVDPTLLDEGKQVISKAKDGFVSAYSIDEVTGINNVLVVYERNGKPLGTKRDGGTGPFRIIVLQDVFGNRSTKYLNEIEVIK